MNRTASQESLQELERLDSTLQGAPSEPAQRPDVFSTSRGSYPRSQRSTGRLLSVLTRLRDRRETLNSGRSISTLSKQLAG